MSNTNWFVVHTKPRKERMALDNLQRQGFTAYCPQTIQPKRRRECWQKVSEPLFPRYLFVQLNMGVDDFTPIRSTLGVIGLIRFGNQPAVMPDTAIEVIQYQEQQIQHNNAKHPQWEKGDKIEIVNSPFAGLKGIFQKTCSVERVMVMIDMLGRENHTIVYANNIMSV